MSLMFPARVGHAVTHGSAKGQGTLGTLGVAIGVGVAYYTGAGEVATLGYLAFGDEVGVWLGKNTVDKILPPVVSGHIVTGFPTVHLGKSCQHAARADEDTTADCEGEHVGWEGSSTVSLGSRPMSRVGDRLKCQGVIAEGEQSIHVGGLPSQAGKNLTEATDQTVYVLTLFGDIAGLAAWEGMGKTAAEKAWTVFDKGTGAYGTVRDALDNNDDATNTALVGKDVGAKLLGK